MPWLQLSPTPNCLMQVQQMMCCVKCQWLQEETATSRCLARVRHLSISMGVSYKTKTSLYNSTHKTSRMWKSSPILVPSMMLRSSLSFVFVPNHRKVKAWVEHFVPKMVSDTIFRAWSKQTWNIVKEAWNYSPISIIIPANSIAMESRTWKRKLLPIGFRK